MLDSRKLPNLRKPILPDPGYVLVDMDLNRADLHGVAWDSGDEHLKNRLKEEHKDPTKNTHKANAIDLFGVMNKTNYDLAKKIAHAANYLVSPRTASAQIGISEADAKKYISRWYGMYPGIPKWHARVDQEIRQTRMVWNKFGYRYVFFQRLDDMLPTAVAWIGQSTTGLLINRILLAIHHNLPLVQLLLQVHDSLLKQIRIEHLYEQLVLIQELAKIVIPYPDPLVIPTGFKISAKSWGDVLDCRISNGFVEVEFQGAWVPFDATKH